MSAAGSQGRPPPKIQRAVDWSALIKQGLLAAVILWLAWQAIGNVAENMQARKIPTSFDFLWATAGFDINQSLISYSATSTYGRAFLVGLLNTLGVAALGIVFATIIGFLIGIARLSQNWLAAKLAGAYVEIIRNTPLLLQLFFWYNAVLAPLPGPRQSLALPAFGLQWPSANAAFLTMAGAGCAAAALIYARRQMNGSFARSAGFAAAALGMFVMAGGLLFGSSVIGMAGGDGLLAVRGGGYAFLNNRGLFVPALNLGNIAPWMAILVFAGVMGAVGFAIWARLRQAETGLILPVGWICAALIVAPPLLLLLAAGEGVSLDYPQLRGFNFNGGTRMYPEFFALLLGLSLYTAAFIAEIVRAGILSVSKGQSEAAMALGLRQPAALKLVIIPQAMRVIIPPLTNQYLNLTKNSSLAVFIGFPDLVQVFVGTVLNQTGAMVQIISIAMAVYLTISLATSYAMNLYNSRMALAER